jgi:hypothetical protein
MGCAAPLTKPLGPPAHGRPRLIREALFRVNATPGGKSARSRDGEAFVFKHKIAVNEARSGRC